MAEKLGVYICSGCSIGESVDTEKLAKVATSEYKAAVCRVHPFLCSPEGVDSIRQDLAAGESGPAVDGVVVAENIVHDRADQDKRNLFRFTQNWNNGMLEYWNDGLKKQCASRMPYPVFQYSTIPSFHMAYKVDDHKKH